MRNAALVVVAALTFTVAGGAAVAAKLQGNISHVDVSALVGPAPTPSKAPDPNDPNKGTPVNILVLGSDSRAGVNAQIGGEALGMRSDTAMVVHISADRTRISVVSIPRDSLVRIPSCTMSNGKTTRATTGMFNSAFATGWDNGGDLASAAGCTIKTVQQDTGVPINHFVVVDFVGFQQMVQAIGGVSMCIPSKIADKDSGLYLNAGNQVLDGPTALAFARARHNVGNGSDINRIGNQQQLVAAMVREVLSRNVLTNPPKLVSFLSAATHSLTTDKQMSIADMTGLAYNLRNINRDNITFMTIPWEPAASDKNRVQWTSAAAQVWADMANDVPPASYVAPAPTTASTAGATAAPTTPTPTATKKAGTDQFSVADTTAVCA